VCLRTYVQNLITSRPCKCVILDCSHISNVDSSGLRVWEFIAKSARKLNVFFLCSNINSHVERIMKTAGVYR